MSTLEICRLYRFLPIVGQRENWNGSHVGAPGSQNSRLCEVEAAGNWYLNVAVHHPALREQSMLELVACRSHSPVPQMGCLRAWMFRFASFCFVSQQRESTSSRGCTPMQALKSPWNKTERIIIYMMENWDRSCLHGTFYTFTLFGQPVSVYFHQHTMMGRKYVQKAYVHCGDVMNTSSPHLYPFQPPHDTVQLCWSPQRFGQHVGPLQICWINSAKERYNMNAHWSSWWRPLGRGCHVAGISFCSAHLTLVSYWCTTSRPATTFCRYANLCEWTVAPLDDKLCHRTNCA